MWQSADVIGSQRGLTVQTKPGIEMQFFATSPNQQRNEDAGKNLQAARYTRLLTAMAAH